MAPETIFDLDAFGTCDTFDYKVHKEGNPDIKIGLTVTLAGNAHPAYQAYVETEFRRITKLLEENEKARADGKTKSAAEEIKSIAETRRENAGPVAARVLHASAPIKFRGEVITLGPTNALEVLSDPRFTWLLIQLRAAAENHENFIPGSAQN